MLVRGEALRQFDMLSYEEGSTTSEKLKSITLGFGKYVLVLMRCQNKIA